MSAKFGKDNHNFKHGGKRSFPVEYRAWSKIKGRCFCKTDAGYHKYGGRGISMCDEWASDFMRFLADMGMRPSNKSSIDRMDNDGDYTPENCEWSNPTKQANNRRSSHLLTHKGETRTIAQWSRITGIKQATLRARIEVSGMSVKDTLETPVVTPKRVLYTHNGITDSIAGWGKRMGWSKNTLYERIRRGMSFKEAIKYPLTPHKRRRAGLGATA
jgi:hypothetical protein